MSNLLTDLMDARAAASKLGLCKNTVTTLASKGKIRSYKVGKRYKFLEADLEAYLATCLVPPAMPLPTRNIKLRHVKPQA